MTWLVLVLPATFAEVIAVSLRGPGPRGYLHVQLLTASLYLGAFVFGKSHRFGSPFPGNDRSQKASFPAFPCSTSDWLTASNNIGWALRAWKVWELEQVRLSKEQRELAIRDDGVLASALEQEPRIDAPQSTAAQRRFSMLKGLWVIERV